MALHYRWENWGPVRSVRMNLNKWKRKGDQHWSSGQCSLNVLPPSFLHPFLLPYLPNPQKYFSTSLKIHPKYEEWSIRCYFQNSVAFAKNTKYAIKVKGWSFYDCGVTVLFLLWGSSPVSYLPWKIQRVRFFPVTHMVWYMSTGWDQEAGGQPSSAALIVPDSCLFLGYDAITWSWFIHLYSEIYGNLHLTRGKVKIIHWIGKSLETPFNRKQLTSQSWRRNVFSSCRAASISAGDGKTQW